MTPIKKLRFKVSALYSLLIVVAIIGVGYGVKAYTNNAVSQPVNVIEKVEKGIWYSEVDRNHTVKNPN